MPSMRRTSRSTQPPTQMSFSNVLAIRDKLHIGSSRRWPISCIATASITSPVSRDPPHRCLLPQPLIRSNWAALMALMLLCFRMPTPHLSTASKWSSSPFNLPGPSTVWLPKINVTACTNLKSSRNIKDVKATGREITSLCLLRRCARSIKKRQPGGRNLPCLLRWRTTPRDRHLHISSPVRCLTRAIPFLWKPNRREREILRVATLEASLKMSQIKRSLSCNRDTWGLKSPRPITKWLTPTVLLPLGITISLRSQYTSRTRSHPSNKRRDTTGSTRTRAILFNLSKDSQLLL